METQAQTCVVNGAELTYVEAGAGHPVVLVHGSLSDYRAWGSQMAPFAERFRVIAISRRRHWPNEWPIDNRECSIVQHASDLGDLIDALGLESPHLIGSSYGALTILTLAVHRPALARTLVLGEPPFMPWLTASADGSELFSDFQTRAWLPARNAFRREDPPGGVRLFIDGVLGEGGFDRLPPPAVERMMDNSAVMRVELETAPETYFPALTREEVRKIQSPALLLTGEASPHIFHRITDELALCLPGAERAEIPRASHVMHAGNPEAYNETVLAFLSRH